MEKRAKRASILIVLWVLAGAVAVLFRVFNLSDLSQALAFLFVGAGGSIFYYGWGSKLAPPEMRERLGFGIPEDEETRLRLFRRFYPTAMAEIDQLPESINESNTEETILDLRFIITQDALMQASSITNDEKAQLESLRGEITHYAVDQVKQRLNAPKAKPPSEEEQRLREKFPKTWLFMDRISHIKSKHDFEVLVAQGRAICYGEFYAYLQKTPRYQIDDTWYGDESSMSYLVWSILSQKKSFSEGKHFWER